MLLKMLARFPDGPSRSLLGAPKANPIIGIQKTATMTTKLGVTWLHLCISRWKLGNTRRGNQSLFLSGEVHDNKLAGNVPVICATFVPETHSLSWTWHQAESITGQYGPAPTFQIPDNSTSWTDKWQHCVFFACCEILIYKSCLKRKPGYAKHVQRPGWQVCVCVRILNLKLWEK